MFIARIGRNIRPPLGGPCPSVLQANKKAGSISENTWPALLRRAERPTTRTINMTLLRRGGRSGQTPKALFYCPTLLQYRNPTLLRSQKACYLSAAASVLRTAVPRELRFQVEGGMLCVRRNIDNRERRKLDSVCNEQDIGFIGSVAGGERGGFPSGRKAIPQIGRQGSGLRAAEWRREAGLAVGTTDAHSGRRDFLPRLLVSGLHHAAHQFG